MTCGYHRGVPEVVDYDPSWSAAFETAADQLRSLGDPGWLVEHIGSTSIDGLAAKPIIDLAVRVQSYDELDAHRRALGAGGWLPIRRQPRSHRVLVRDRDGRRTHIAHFFTADQWETCHQRIFRDWLRNHPDDRARYQAVKLQAANSADYALIKEPVVREIVNRARADRGWDPVTELDPGE